MTALEGWEEGGLPEGLFSDEQSFLPGIWGSCSGDLFS